MKDNKLQNYLKHAKVAAENSHDNETQVGSVLIHKDTGIPLVSGFNGFIRGAHDHILPRTRPKKYEHIIHAEKKMLSNCLRTRVSLEHCIVVNTLSPCKDCTIALWEAGLDTIYFPTDQIHPSFEETLAISDINVETESVGKFTKITLTEKVINNG